MLKSKKVCCSSLEGTNKKKRKGGRREGVREREMLLTLPNVSKYSLRSSSELSELRPPTKMRFTYTERERQRDRETESDDFATKYHNITKIPS